MKMKLVQLLAKELKEWPEGVVVYFQWGDGEVFATSKGVPTEYSGSMWYVVGRDIEMAYDAPMYNKRLDLADDHDTAVVSKAQWQAEREKMNKPKWIRHRGGKQPVEDSVKIEYRMRDGDISNRLERAADLRWAHLSLSSDIMAYRIIEETKDQEIEEVKKTNFGTLPYKLEVDTSSAMIALNELSAKWDQLESPLKWRDEIIELEAYEEEFRRKRENLIRKLESEGFKLIDHMAPVYGEQIIDMSDWRNWKTGDIVLISNDPDIKDGEYKITRTEEYDYDGDLPIQTGDGWVDFSEATVKFIRRP